MSPTLPDQKSDVSGCRWCKWSAQGVA